MDKKQIADRASQLENAMRSLKQTKFLARDNSKLKDSEKYILWMLATLNDGGPVRPSEAAKKLNVTLAAVTHLINSLEKQGLVDRSPSPGDRRVTLISLSAKGTEFVATLRKSYWKKLCGLVEYLGDGDSADLVRLVTKMHDYVKETHGS